MLEAESWSGIAIALYIVLITCISMLLISVMIIFFAALGFWGCARLLDPSPPESGQKPRKRKRLLFRMSRDGVLWLALAGLLLFIGWSKSINLLIVLAYLMLLVALWNALAAGRGLRQVEGRD